MDFKTQLGLCPETGLPASGADALLDYVKLKLLALGLPVPGEAPGLFGIGRPLLDSYREQGRLLADYLAPADRRIESFLAAYFGDLGPEEIPHLPRGSLVLDRHGMARTLSLPAQGDHYASKIIDSYRIAQGVLHNPKSDRRTTSGVFHVAENGLPVPDDKKAVPLLTAARIFARAFNPPPGDLALPFLTGTGETGGCWVSLLLRPVVVPGVAGFTGERSMEVRFFAPGSLVSNLDFVESIFGNAGDPALSLNDAGLEPERWTGHTGGVILAPHILGLPKKDLGLPHISEATERQKRDGMCWEAEDELYNDGGAFKITCRDARGVMVTAIADNYFGYCKKEVKTQISFAANLLGGAEEEHAGGALVFPGYDLGEDFELSRHYRIVDHTFKGVLERAGSIMEPHPDGYAVDRNYPDIYYIPEDARIELNNQRIRWTRDGAEKILKLLPDRTYVLPSGYKVEMLKPAEGRRWRLAGYTAECGVFHKPCTVSGGGKSEISKPITDAIISGPVFVSDFKKDFDQAEAIINREYGERFRDPARNRPKGRPLLGKKRSLGSVIKLLTPSEIEYNDDYNAWLTTIPQHVRELVFIIKRFYKEDWGDNWRERFSVDLINGVPGNELRYRGQKMVTQYLRVGYTKDGSWRTFGLRKDFLPAAKISLEDDISASVVAPSGQLRDLPAGWQAPAAKFVHNCEYRFFQRPDDAVIRGYDKQAEADLSSPGSFLSNYQPRTRAEAKEEIEDAIRFGQYTAPMRKRVLDFAAAESPDFYATSAWPRMVDGKPTKNPRYLQVRPDLTRRRATYLGEVSTRFFRRMPADAPLLRPVTAFLPGRRNNPPDPAAGIGALCVFNPIHHLELPELFMEYIASITGKSPSTTGAGSEGALTKAPFNALPPVYDLNNALVAHLATDQPVFITAAGYVGPRYRVDHDISLLVPEIWSRLRPEETDPAFLIENGFLEAVEDIEENGETIPASRLGYRITKRFVRIFFGRVFSNPSTVFNDEMLRPELQDRDIFVSGMKTIVAAHREAALHYFADGSVEQACPPLKALLHIMAHGEYEGADLRSDKVRALFTRPVMMESEWYAERLDSQQVTDLAAWKRHTTYLRKFLERESHRGVADRLGIEERLAAAEQRLAKVSSPDYRQNLVGTLGRQPIPETGA